MLDASSTTTTPKIQPYATELLFTSSTLPHPARRFSISNPLHSSTSSVHFLPKQPATHGTQSSLLHGENFGKFLRGSHGRFLPCLTFFHHYHPKISPMQQKFLFISSIVPYPTRRSSMSSPLHSHTSSVHFLPQQPATQLFSHKLNFQSHSTQHIGIFLGASNKVWQDLAY
jgi:hypothetical protein